MAKRKSHRRKAHHCKRVKGGRTLCWNSKGKIVSNRKTRRK